MAAKLRSWWQQIKQHRVATVLLALFVTLVVLVLLGGYLFHWDWTGINSQENKTTIISTPQGIYRAIEVQSEKNLWDWLGLLATLAIPVVVALGAVWFTTELNKQQNRTEHEITLDNQREAALQEYIDKMSELLLNNSLRKSEPEDEVRKIAQVRTLNILSRLDNNRKGNVLQFLYKSDLIGTYDINKHSRKDKPVISLWGGADLRGVKLPVTLVSLDGADLSGADLRGAELSGIFLTGATLRSTNLEEADLGGAYFSDADLSGAKLNRLDLSGLELSRTNLIGAQLEGTNLSSANLEEAILDGANLKNSNLSGANLRKAEFGDEDGSIYDGGDSSLYETYLKGDDLDALGFEVAFNPVIIDFRAVQLEGANLSKAILKSANVTEKQLEQAKSLKGAIMPDGSIHT